MKYFNEMMMWLVKISVGAVCLFIMILVTELLDLWWLILPLIVLGIVSAVTEVVRSYQGDD